MKSTTQISKWEQLKLPWISFSTANNKLIGLNDGMKSLVPDLPEKSSLKDIKSHPFFSCICWDELNQVSDSGVMMFQDDDEGIQFVANRWNSGEDSGILLLLTQNLKQEVNNILFNNNVAAIYQIHSDGSILNCNSSFASVLGAANREELIGKNILDFYFDPFMRDEFLTEIRKEGNINNFEVILRKKDGNLLWCIENSSLVEKDGVESIVGSLIDITQDKLTRERLSLIFQESTDAIILLKGLNYVDCNSRALEIFGYEKEDILSKEATKSLQYLIKDNPEKEEYIKHKIEGILRGESQKLKALLRRKDGSHFHGEVNFVPFSVLNEHYVEIIIHDISERVLFEKTIRESEERFKLLSNVAIEGVVFVDESIIIDCNDQFAILSGWRSRSSIVGRKIDEFIESTDLGRLKHMIEIPSVNRIEVRGTHESGRVMILEASGSKISYMDSEVEAYLFYDITSRKKTEQALEQSINRFKGLVENSPNAVFILTDGKIKYSNQSGTKLLGYKDEDDVYDIEFSDLFNSKHRRIIGEELNRVREGEEVDYREVTLIDKNKKPIDVGIRSILTVYDGKPSIQVTINNLSTERLLYQEKSRAQLAEEINSILKKEIKEHKETQQKLQEARNFARNIIESSLDMIIAVDDNLQISEFNTSARKHFGYSAEEILGKPIRKLFAEKSNWTMVNEELMKNGYFSGEVKNIKKKGEEFTSFLSASLIRAKDGTIIGSMGVSRDITEMKKAETELRASEERYRDLFENVLDYILSLDLDGSILYANHSFMENLGYSSTELRSLTIFDLVEKGKLDKRKSLFKQLEGQNLSITLINKNGNKLLLRGNCNVKYENDKPDSIRAIFRNVTEVVEQRAKLESIFNSTENILMWTVDKSHRLTSFNNNLKKVWKSEFGVNVTEQMPFIEALEKNLNKDFYQGQLDLYNRTFNGDPQQFEIPFLNKKGENIWLQFFLNPVHYDGNLEEVSCMAYDVTDRKEIDRRILDALKEKEVLLQEVHHRVKNNLQVISSILNLQSSYVSDTQTLEVLKESQNRIKSMSYIHETLYQTSDFGSIEFSDYISVITRNLIHSYTTDRPVSLKPKFDRICLSLDQAIPCGLIVNELVSNALKYAFPEKDDPELLVEILEDDQNKITIRVSDNGIGLSEDFAFEESNSLGIQLVYSLVEQLDGELTINSKAGTEFIVTFDKVD